MTTAERNALLDQVARAMCHHCEEGVPTHGEDHVQDGQRKPCNSWQVRAFKDPEDTEACGHVAIHEVAGKDRCVRCGAKRLADGWDASTIGMSHDEFFRRESQAEVVRLTGALAAAEQRLAGAREVLPEEIREWEAALDATLQFLARELGRSHQGYYSPPGWAGARLLDLRVALGGGSLASTGTRVSERHRRIVGACMQHVFYRQGLRTELPPSLLGYSLAEILEANRLVKAENMRPRQGEGERTTMMVCDERLVAALYAAYHYDPEPAADATPLVVLKDRVLVCLDMTALKKAEDGGDAA